MFPVQSVRPVSSEAQLPVHKSGSILGFKHLQVVLCGEILTFRNSDIVVLGFD